MLQRLLCALTFWRKQRRSACIDIFGLLYEVSRVDLYCVYVWIIWHTSCICMAFDLRGSATSKEGIESFNITRETMTKHFSNFPLFSIELLLTYFIWDFSNRTSLTYLWTFSHLKSDQARRSLNHVYGHWTYAKKDLCPATPSLLK